AVMHPTSARATTTPLMASMRLLATPPALRMQPLASVRYLKTPPETGTRPWGIGLSLATQRGPRTARLVTSHYFPIGRAGGTALLGPGHLATTLMVSTTSGSVKMLVVFSPPASTISISAASAWIQNQTQSGSVAWSSR